MSAARLLTGATGFVGGAITLELLKATAGPIVCVVRPGVDGTGPEQRLHASLKVACHMYGEPDLLDIALERCTAVAGDLNLPGCGVDLAGLPEIVEVWHAAASLAFEDEQEEAIAAANVGGTEQTLALARSLGVTTFNHISTAYVGGARGGLLKEEIAPCDAPSNNAYERTKLAGEHLVVAAGLPQVRIFRPAIVIGHSQTHAATAFTGLYGFVRNLYLLQEQVSEVLGDMLVHRPLRLIADGAAPINLIPIDMVARSAVALSQSDSTAQIFHLTNSEPLELDAGVSVIARLVGIRQPRYVQSVDELTSIDEQVDERLRFYGSYIRGRLEFDRRNVDAVLGSASGAFPMNSQTIEPFVSWYLDRLKRAKSDRSVDGAVA